VGAELAKILGAYLDEVERADTGYREFHWGDDSQHTLVHDHPLPPAVAYELGPLVEVVYAATKAGDRYHWQHRFESPRPVLAYGDNHLWILGGGYRVTARGIVG
jgi:hypothetical protein